MLAPLQLPAIGGHGAELRPFPGGASDPNRTPSLSADLKRKLATIAEIGPGVLIEDKGYSLALHYRLAPEKGEAVWAAVADICAAAPPGTTSLGTLTRVLEWVNWHEISKDKPEAWLYFYEDFLEVYDNKLRKRTGSYYTPPEVVAAMVNLVDEALRGPLFERLIGFAAADVIVADPQADGAAEAPDRRFRPPAVGTGTFLLGVLRRIASTVAEDQGAGAVRGAIEAAANG